MAMEPVRDDSGTTMLAVIVGGIVVVLVALFAFGAFESRAPDAGTSISVETPNTTSSTPAPSTPAPAPSEPAPSTPTTP